MLTRGCRITVRIIGLSPFWPRFRALPAKPESGDCTDAAKGRIEDGEECAPNERRKPAKRDPNKSDAGNGSGLVCRVHGSHLLAVA